MAQSEKPLRDDVRPAQLVPQVALGGAAARQERPPEMQIDDSKATSRYANFCRITGTPEEMIIDFGLNPQPFGIPTAPIVISQRIVMNPYVAKRMAYVLQLTVERYEATFGALETDVQKRAQRL